MESELCQICQTNKFKYSCPKCNISYCSVKCYQDEKHLICSENFYKQCVEEEISNQISTKNTKEIHKMLEILQRVSNEHENRDCVFEEEESLDELDSDDEEEEESLLKRIENININDADILWNSLTKQEKLKFENLIENGEISKVVPPFHPWWSKKISVKIVRDIDYKEEEDLKTLDYPPIADNIASFDNIMKKSPSLSIRYSLSNIIGAYTCIVRYYAGDHLLSSLEAANYLWKLSSVLSKKSVFNSNEEALKSIIIDGQNEALGMDIEDYSVIYKDVNDIFNGPFERENSDIYKLSALSDIQNIFIKAKHEIKNQKKQNKSDFSKKFANVPIDDELNKENLKKIIKKIDFFLSYVKSQVHLECI
ncbi:zinc finger HIT domain-containing protein 2 [Condylostylus longicornis]|uniref:zinc finger HIT domain-containing protein 2 n=1 Tax=Condylostylus longicornis TaxID=2530218 RepID=UPI00244DD8E2|nr:zinc finger HIT domain-containing protein 2 [Condylostylus longicornis]